MLTWVLMALAAAGGWFGLLSALAWKTRQERPELGLVDGRLRPCGTAPNCVGSEAADESHAIPALLPGAASEETWQQLKALLVSEPRMQLIAEDDTYLRYEARTPLMGFVDDLEFRFDRKARTIHVRSASRVGHGDMGANRKRVDDLRARLEVALSNDATPEK